jgi:hypothetical protein
MRSDPVADEPQQRVHQDVLPARAARAGSVPLWWQQPNSWAGRAVDSRASRRSAASCRCRAGARLASRAAPGLRRARRVTYSQNMLTHYTQESQLSGCLLTILRNHSLFSGSSLTILKNHCSQDLRSQFSGITYCSQDPPLTILRNCSLFSGSSLTILRNYSLFSGSSITILRNHSLLSGS